MIKVNEGFARLFTSRYWLKTESGQNKTFAYWFKAIKWLLVNSLFGLFPLMIMGVVNWLTNGKEGNNQIDHLIYEGGIVLFVCIAIMGAVAGDYLLSGTKFSGIEVFSIYIFPGMVAGFISLEFVLVCLEKVNKYAVGLTSKKTLVLLTYSFLYCVSVKTSLFIKEDSENNKQVI